MCMFVAQQIDRVWLYVCVVTLDTRQSMSEGIKGQETNVLTLRWAGHVAGMGEA